MGGKGNLDNYISGGVNIYNMERTKIIKHERLKSSNL